MLWLVGNGGLSWAQSRESPSLPTLTEQRFSLLRSLPNLDSLTELAIAHSPRIQAQDHLIERERQRKKSSQKLWMDKLFSDVGYAYSNSFANVVSGNTANGGNTVEANNLTIGDNIRAGVTLRLSLFDVLGRRHQTNVVKEELAIARLQKEEMIEEIKVQVQLYYDELLSAERLLQIYSQKKQALDLQKLMAEKEFEEGQLPISELGRVTELASNAEIDFVKAQLDVKRVYEQLSSYVGL